MEPEDSEEAVLRLQASLQQFIDNVDKLDNEEDPSGDGFTREFRILRELGLKMREENTHPAEEGRKPHNIKKNRYKDILPFDETRVELEKIDGEEGSDYINANYISDHTGSPSYIASQGPVPSTVNDFWRMIWQQKVKVMAMACRLVELGKKKCEQYWPSDVQETQEFGDIKVTLQTEDDFAEHCTKRVMKIQKDAEIRRLTQFHYTGWPDHDIPDDIDDILEMIALMRQIKLEDPTSPMVVHCSAGCGRTGTICAIDYAWTVLKSGKLTEDFNLFQVIKYMREQRQSMIQAPEQYKCAHIAIKILFEKHLNLMEDHTYGNIMFDQDDEDSGYTDPQSLKDAKLSRKASAMTDDIEKTIQDLTASEMLNTENSSDPTPVIIPQHVASTVAQPKASTQGNKPTLNMKPSIARKPSTEIHIPKDKPPSPIVKHMVYAVEKIENIPASKGNPPQNVVKGATAERHQVTLNKPDVSYTNVEFETKSSSINSAKSVFDANGNALTGSQILKDKPTLQRIESRQENNKFTTVISVGASASKSAVNKTVSDPGKGSLGNSQYGSQKAKTLPNKPMPGVYEAPQSSVPPSTLTQSASSMYSYASAPATHSYSILEPLSSVNGSPQNPGRPLVQPIGYNGVEEAGNQSQIGDVYAIVNKPVVTPKQTDNVYETLAVGQAKAPPPIPDRNYVEDEKPPAHEKPGSSDQYDTKKGKLGTLKQMFTGNKMFGSGSSDNATTNAVPGFRVRLGQKPMGAKKTPAIWTNTKL